MYGESDNVDLSIHREIDRIVLRSPSYLDRKIIKVSLLFIIFSGFKCIRPKHYLIYFLHTHTHTHTHISYMIYFLHFVICEKYLRDFESYMSKVISLFSRISAGISFHEYRIKETENLVIFFMIFRRDLNARASLWIILLSLNIISTTLAKLIAI
jgi:hypothetical protein